MKKILTLAAVLAASTQVNAEVFDFNNMDYSDKEVCGFIGGGMMGFKNNVVQTLETEKVQLLTTFQENIKSSDGEVISDLPLCSLHFAIEYNSEDLFDSIIGEVPDESRGAYQDVFYGTLAKYIDSEVISNMVYGVSKPVFVDVLERFPKAKDMKMDIDGSVVIKFVGIPEEQRYQLNPIQGKQVQVREIWKQVSL